MMYPLTSLALRQPAINSMRARQRSATVAARPAVPGEGHSARRCRFELFDAVQNPDLFRGSLFDGLRRIAGQGGALGRHVAANDRATSISRDPVRSSSRRRASCSMSCFRVALELQKLVGDAPASIW